MKKTTTLQCFCLFTVAASTAAFSPPMRRISSISPATTTTTTTTTATTASSRVNPLWVSKTTQQESTAAVAQLERMIEEQEQLEQPTIQLKTTQILVDDSSLESATGTPSKTETAGGLFWRAVVVALCAFWASNFAVAKLVMAEPGVDSSLYALARFGVAALALLPGAFSKRHTLDAATAKGAAICGSWVAFGYLGQTLALLTTTASRSCVICTLHCVFVAIVAETVRVSRAAAGTTQFDFMRLVPAAVAVAGVAIVELKGAGGAPTIGDALSFAQPIGFGLGYLQLEELMRQKPAAALPVSAIKLMVVALASFGMYEFSPLLMEGLMPSLPDFGPIISSPVAMGGILYTGLVTTALALWVESIAFKRVPATDASIILTTEPLFAAAAGAFALGETFGISDYIGATLIIGACALAVLLDDEASDDKCELKDELQGKCEPHRTFPISAE